MHKSGNQGSPGHKEELATRGVQQDAWDGAPATIGLRRDGRQEEKEEEEKQT